MSNYKINISELNKRIEIQNFTTVTSAKGFDEKKWAKYTENWAKKIALSGKEFWAAKTTNSEDTVKFIVRYSATLKVLLVKNAKILYRIKHENIIYKLVFANNIQEKNEWIEIKCEETNE